MKYRPGFPERFGAIEHGRSHCGDFFGWYNTEHRHGGLGLLTPHDVHHGLAGARLKARDGRLRCCPAGAVPRRRAGGGCGAERGLDQQAEAGFTDRGGASVISAAGCLIHVDRFRGRILGMPSDEFLDASEVIRARVEQAFRS
jgi:hypothetical protein